MRAVALLAAAATLVGSPAAAQYTAKQMLDWAAEALPGTEDWRVIEILPYALTLSSPDEVTLTSDGLARADIRHEFRQSMEMEAGLVRSIALRVEVDCRGLRYRILSMALYRSNNLQDLHAKRDGQGAWLPYGDNEKVVEAVCDAIHVGKKLD